MAKRVVDEDSLTTVADAIRDFGYSNEKLVFPDDFSEELQNIKNLFVSVLDRTITEFTTPKGLTVLGNCSLRNNLFLTKLTIGEELVEIVDYALMGCTKLSSVTFRGVIDAIRSFSFANCTALTEITIPVSGTVGNYAFQNCTGLTTVTFIGRPMRNIGQDAFTGCAKIKTINVPWAEGAVPYAPWGATNATINYNYVVEG